MSHHAFRSLYGRPPTAVYSAPGRVNQIGEHVDYNDGFVLPVAIDRRAVAAAARRPDREARIASVQQPDVVTHLLGEPSPGGWVTHVLGVVWALEERGFEVPGFDLLIDSDVPVGAGLSSSAAVEVATAAALLDLVGSELEPMELALLCHRAETAYVGAPVGVMDHVVSVCATAGNALLVDCRTLARREIPVDLPGHTWLVIDTGVRHDNTDGSYSQLRARCAKAAEQLGVQALRDVHELQRVDQLPPDLRDVATHVVCEIARVHDAVAALEAHDAELLGVLLLASHRSLANDAGVSCPELDLVVTAAVAAGASGARLTGAGWGGCVLVLSPEPVADAVLSSVRDAFLSAGLPAPEVVPVHPAAGVHRVPA